MKAVVQTEYQDIYRITDGVLLVVNKFEPLWEAFCYKQILSLQFFVY